MVVSEDSDSSCKQRKKALESGSNVQPVDPQQSNKQCLFSMSASRVLLLQQALRCRANKENEMRKRLLCRALPDLPNDLRTRCSEATKVRAFYRFRQPPPTISFFFRVSMSSSSSSFSRRIPTATSPASMKRVLRACSPSSSSSPCRLLVFTRQTGICWQALESQVGSRAYPTPKLVMPRFGQLVDERQNQRPHVALRMKRLILYQFDWKALLGVHYLAV